MLSFTGLRTLFGQLTNDPSTTNLAFGDKLINDSIRTIATIRPWWFLETTDTVATVASQQSYQVPNSIRKLTDIYVTVGTQIYAPVFVGTPEEWKVVLASNLGTSDVPMFWYRDGNKVYFSPTPASSANTITFRGRAQIRDLSIADYTTGTVVSIANGATAVVGSGTTWTASMVGRYIKITESDTANKGDGQWYEIGSYTSATSIGLLKPYEGTSIAAGAAAYTIGQMSVLPQEYDIAPIYRAAAVYYEKEDVSAAERFWRMYDGGYEMGLSSTYGGVVGRMIEDGDKNEDKYRPPSLLNAIIDPNVPPRTTLTGF